MLHRSANVFRFLAPLVCCQSDDERGRRGLAAYPPPLCVRARRAFGPVSASAWRDGLAVAVALWPFLMLVDALATELLQMGEALYTAGGAMLERPAWTPFMADSVVVAALPVLAVVLGRWWIAALGAGVFVWHQAAHPRLLDLDTLLFPNHGPVLLAKVMVIVIACIPAAHRAIRRIPHAFLAWGPIAVAGLAASKAIVRWVDVIAYRDIVTWKPVPWLVVVAPAAGYTCRSAVGRRAALYLFLPAAALGDLGDLLFVPTSIALAQIGCVALAFAVTAAVTRRRNGPAAAAPHC
ncbi:hypothetical protein E1292_35840 [Nonomuraea deserti]|uniref:Uncharacterized protein n=1 Tax=Nonomuraea deserti TaxID=1848322 RepID=A0A4R4V8L2_9ACTN|nr:hypothetical protein [Nonomuraea deserti]TDC98033.1 hypothetical protein E1292_35840 [Nonomuraea deserti]